MELFAHVHHAFDWRSIYVSWPQCSPVCRVDFEEIELPKAYGTGCQPKTDTKSSLESFGSASSIGFTFCSAIYEQHELSHMLSTVVYHILVRHHGRNGLINGFSHHGHSTLLD